MPQIATHAATTRVSFMRFSIAQKYVRGLEIWNNYKFRWSGHLYRFHAFTVHGICTLMGPVSPLEATAKTAAHVSAGPILSCREVSRYLHGRKGPNAIDRNPGRFSVRKVLPRCFMRIQRLHVRLTLHSSHICDGPSERPIFQ